MKIKILFVVKAREWGGTEIHLQELLLRLDFSKVDVTLIWFGIDVYSANLKEKFKLPVKTVDGRQVSTFGKYLKAFRSLKPAIIVFVNSDLGWFPWFAYLAAKMSQARRLVAIEQLIGEKPPQVLMGKGIPGAIRQLFGWRARFMLRIRIEGILCDNVICVSNAVRDRLVNDYGFPPSKTLIIPNGVNLSYFGVPTNSLEDLRKSLNISAQDFVILCVARLSKQKRLDLLLEAMVEVRKECSGCKCIIVGKGPLEADLTQKAYELGLSGSVYFVGHTEDVRPYLELANVFALSSIREGLPLSLAEAMAYGKPCVATNVGGNKEIIDHGKTGFIVEPGQATELAQAILHLLGNSELRKEMGSQGLEKVKRDFDLDNLLRDCIEVIFKK